MSEKPSPPEDEVKKAEKRQLSRRGFFRLFRGSKTEETVDNDADEPKQPKRYKIPFTNRTITRRRLILFLAAYPPTYYFVSQYRGYCMNAISDIFILDDYGEEVMAQMDYLKERYDCEMQFESFGQLSLQEKKKAVANLKRVLSKYPPEMIQSYRINWIFQKYIFKDGQYVNGHVSGIGVGIAPDIRQEIYIARSGCNEKSIHHELFHVFDEDFDSEVEKEVLEKLRDQIAPHLDLDFLQYVDEFAEGYNQNHVNEACACFANPKSCEKLKKYYEQWLRLSKKEREKVVRNQKQIMEQFELILEKNNYFETNPVWAKLNPNGEQAYHRNRQSFFGCASEKPEGLENFMREYGQKNENEDQATCAEVMFVDMPYITEALAPSCEEGRNCVKLNKIKKMMEYYHKWSGGKMDDQYWADLRGGKVDEAYWDTKKPGPLKSAEEKIPSVFL